MSTPKIDDQTCDVVMDLVDYFHSTPISSTIDERCVALAMALSETIGAHFAPEDWHERVERIAHVIMTDLLGGYDSEYQN